MLPGNSRKNGDILGKKPILRRGRWRRRRGDKFKREPCVWTCVLERSKPKWPTKVLTRGKKELHERIKR